MLHGLHSLDRDPDATPRTLRNWERLRSRVFTLTPYRSLIATTTLSDDDYFLNCTSGTFNVKLPSARAIPGRVYIVKNTGAGTITVMADGTEEIDGSNTLVLAAGDIGRLVATDTSNWMSW